MNKQKRLLTLALVIGFVLALFVSSAYIAREAYHECTGEECDICEHIGACRALLRSFVLLVFMLAAGLALLLDSQRKHAANGIRLPAQASLVSWKVRLNN